MIVRTFQVADSSSKKEALTVRQLHYTGWPDHSVPSGESMACFQEMLDDFLKWIVTSGNQKAVVHCSAGIGRTGTTISLAHAIIGLWVQRNAGVKEP